MQRGPLVRHVPLDGIQNDALESRRIHAAAHGVVFGARADGFKRLRFVVRAADHDDWSLRRGEDQFAEALDAPIIRNSEARQKHVKRISVEEGEGLGKGADRSDLEDHRANV